MTEALHETVALVTGAGSGMGAETAVLLAAEGSHVVLVGRNDERLQAVHRRITEGGGASTVIVCDIADGAQLRDLVVRVRAEIGPIDILINNAGSASRVLNPQYTATAEWRGVVDVNLTAVFELTQAVLPDLLASPRGTVVTVSSLAAVNPNLLGGAAYGAAKAAVRNFMTFLHNTFRNDGLRAITVLPGEADTPILDNRARPPRPDERRHMLQSVDIARAIHLAVVLPQRVVLQEIVVAPTRQRDTAQDLEVSRWVGAPDGAAPTSTATA